MFYIYNLKLQLLSFLPFTYILYTALYRYILHVIELKSLKKSTYATHHIADKLLVLHLCAPGLQSSFSHASPWGSALVELPLAAVVFAPLAAAVAPKIV